METVTFKILVLWRDGGYDEVSAERYWIDSDTKDLWTVSQGGQTQMFHRDCYKNIVITRGV